ncbi:hypothetical protein T439DRAFT_204744 [Meredithblackwellia eburnea MCA 4105]
MLLTTSLFLLAHSLSLLPVTAAPAPASNGTLGSFSWQSTKYIFAFGDSYSASNWHIEKGLLSPDDGVTTANGPNWIQHLSRTFNDSNILLRDMAANGASIDNDLIAITDHETGVAQQIAKFEKHLSPPPDEIPWQGTNTLFSIWVGINDCDLSYERPNQRGWHNREFKVWRSLMEKLYSRGARHFLFMTVPPTYASPLYFGRGDLKEAILDYNKVLRMNALRFQDDHPDAVVLFHDAHTSFSLILDNANQEGFKKTLESCPAYRRGTPSLTTFYAECEYAVNEYFWTDDLHPSSPVHKLLARRIVEFLRQPRWLIEEEEEVNGLGDGEFLDTGAQGERKMRRSLRKRVR